jgi:hypothetical protein
VITGYGPDSTILDALSQYVGEGNDFTGLYSRNIARPFRSLVGDVGEGSDGLIALITMTDNRVNDRTNGIISRPGSLTHPAEIAAEMLGYMAYVNNDKAETSYVGAILSGVDPGILARKAGDDWTTEYNNRDLAVHNGIGPTIVSDGAVKLQNVVSFYRPSNIPETSNCYRRMRDISIIQNIQYNYKLVFGSEKWTNFTVVNNVANVQNVSDRALARDAGMVIDDLLALINGFMGFAWLYDPAPSVASLKKPGAVTTRSGGTGFNTFVDYVFSGEGNILSNVVNCDTSFSIMATLG